MRPRRHTSNTDHPSTFYDSCGLPPRNGLPLNRSDLTTLLTLLSDEIGRSGWFTIPVRLAVHGGAQIVLHGDIAWVSGVRLTTRDVDYLGQPFEQEAMRRGHLNAHACLRECIMRAAMAFGVPELGLDWMNCDPDGALRGLRG